MKMTKAQADTLDEITRLAADLQRAEMDVARARARLTSAILSDSSLTKAQMARAAGLSRQRISQIVAAGGEDGSV